jgi:hypothetical protein
MTTLLQILHDKSIQLINGANLSVIAITSLVDFNLLLKTILVTVSIIYTVIKTMNEASQRKKPPKK